MTKFELECEWCSASDDAPEIQQTMALLLLRVGDANLTEHVDIWTNTLRERVLVSAYPLAMWLASSWWRLLVEPLPPNDGTPPLDWRLAHELGAANGGFVWPHVLLVPNQNVMRIWARPSPTGTQQSVRYTRGLSAPAAIPLSVFEQTAERFIASVIGRLDSGGLSATALANLWTEVCAERADSAATHYRRAEARIGVDPDAASVEAVEMAMRGANRIVI